jgi:dipeptidyl aminopeptidase/acylaminoacyl peptidase
MSRKRDLQAIGLMIAVLLISGCGGAFAPAPPKATPIPTPDHSVLAASKRVDPVGDRSPHASVVYTLPEMDQVTLANIEYKDGLTMDVYYPPDFDFAQNLPVVIFVNGFVDGEIKQMIGCKLKDAGIQISWAQLVAASGMIAITYETQVPDTDIHDLIIYARANAPWLRIDKDSICLWACSANPRTQLIALTDTSAEYRDSLACAVIYYGVTPEHYVDGLSADVPLFIVKAGKDDASVNQDLDCFVEAAREASIPLEFVDYENGIHGFDYWQNTDESREIVKQTVEFMKEHLFE